MHHLRDWTGYTSEIWLRVALLVVEYDCICHLYDWTGYANEVGEAFRALVNVKWVWASYGVASSYVVADATHKAWQAYSQVT